MPDLLDIGSLAKRTRRDRRWSRTKLAEKSGVSLARIEALENHRTADIGFKKLMRILNALDLDIRLTTLNQNRPTLEDLMEESSEPDDPRMVRPRDRRHT
jgi:transcriptional regulator with XRE-family HTH domain